MDTGTSFVAEVTGHNIASAIVAADHADAIGTLAANTTPCIVATPGTELPYYTSARSNLLSARYNI